MHVRFISSYSTNEWITLRNGYYFVTTNYYTKSLLLRAHTHEGLRLSNRIESASFCSTYFTQSINTHWRTYIKNFSYIHSNFLNSWLLFFVITAVFMNIIYIQELKTLQPKKEIQSKGEKGKESHEKWRMYVLKIHWMAEIHRWYTHWNLLTTITRRMKIIFYEMEEITAILSVKEALNRMKIRKWAFIFFRLSIPLCEIENNLALK